jgi:2'-5' RNA ligase
VVETYRVFVAIELPRAVRAKVIEHIEQLRRIVPDARASWSREHNLHLTLKFLGNVPVSEIPKVSDAVARAVTAIKPFAITVAGCGVFPPKGRPNVLWLGVENRTSELNGLYRQIEDECSKAGFAREQRTLHPHLTIARLRKHGDERHLTEVHEKLGFASETFSVSELVVFKSELLREGSKHTPISRHSLQK